MVFQELREKYKNIIIFFFYSNVFVFQFSPTHPLLVRTGNTTQSSLLSCRDRA